MNKMRCNRIYALLAVLICFVLLSGCSEKSELIESSPEGAKIIINEAMSRNSYFAALPDGSCYDWIELRNISEESVNLQGYGLSDDTANARRWVISESVSVAPGDYVVIYLSGLDEVDEHGNLHASFRLSSKGETLILSNAFGAPTQVFELPECPLENISYGFDERDPGGDCVWMAEPSPGRACSGDTNKNSGELKFSSNGVIINEYMTNNTFTVYDKDSEYSDWIELCNPTDEEVSLAGCSLSDKGVDGSRWYFPDNAVIGAGEYLLVFCSGKSAAIDGELHTSFRLGGADTSLVFFSPSGLEMLSMDISALPENVSCGIDPATGEWMLFSEATPGRANDTYPYAMGTPLRGTPAGDIMISEALAVSADGSDEAARCDYIELFNSSAQVLSLKGYSLTDSFGTAGFVFPDVPIQPGGYVTVQCTGKENAASEKEALSAGFKLDQGGETLYLCDPDGHVADIFETGKQTYGVTRGRLADDPSQWWYFTAATPGASNPSDKAAAGYTGSPEFYPAGGAVEKGTVVRISGAEDSVVRYTLDGSEPDRSSSVYDPEKGITISSTTVIRAVAFKGGLLASQPIAATFFVDADHTIPVLCLTSDPEGLFSEETGIYSGGRGILGDEPNYMSEEERPCVVEYYVEGKRAFVVNAGTKIFGAGSRAYSQKSFSILLREKYGANSVSFPLFEDNNVTTFSSLVIRQSGQECRFSKLRDELVAAIVKNRVNCDYMDCTPAILYINGEYWGLYYVREKLNEDYLFYKYGYEKDSLDIIKKQRTLTAGSMTDYQKLYEYAETHDLSEDENYREICAMLDKDSLIDFWICETFFGNDDTTNIREYHCRAEGQNNKWGWMLFDLDNAFYPHLMHKNLIYANLLDPEGHGQRNGASNVIIRKLLENSDFLYDFVSRYCYHLKNTFTVDRMTGILDEMAETIRPEIPGQCERWGWPSTETWESSVEGIRGFMEKRPETIIRHIKSSFGLSDSEFQAIYDAS